MNNQYAPPTANLDHNAGEGGVTGAMLEALRKTKTWVLVVGIAMFIAAAFTILAALMMVFAGEMMGGGKNPMPRGAMAAMGGFYLIFAFVYGVLGYYLVKYSGAISDLLRDGLSQTMERALQYQQKFWRLAGFIVLLFVALFVFGIGAAILIPAMSR